MRVRLLPASPGDVSGEQHLTTYVVDDVVAIDAGCLGLHSTARGVSALTRVFLTHAHIDHVGTLPIFLENGQARAGSPVRVYGPLAALEALQEHFFNDRVWLDHSLIGENGQAWVELRPISPEEPVVVDGLRILPVPVAHTVPTYGYVIDDGTSVVVFGADSGPTDRIWEIARATGRLRAVFLECSFPDALENLAAKTGHLTPRLWDREVAKLPPDATVFAVHMKPRTRDRVLSELAGLAGGRARICEIGREYSL